MAGYIENTSLPIQPFSDAQASILDFLFPGFTRVSTVVQWYLAIDLSAYVPLLCLFGLFVFACGRICEYLLGWLQTYCTSTVHLRYREDAYDILMLWISSQSFARNTRSSLVTTDLASSLKRSGHNLPKRPDGNKKTLYYTPWNGRFFIRYKGRWIVFKREFRAGEFVSREEVSISCFGTSPQILRELLSECCAEYTKLVRDKTCLYEHRDDTWTRSAVSNIRRISTVILDQKKKEELLDDMTDFLNPTSQQWYSDRGIPYRRGYLLYGPPGTGKTSLSSALAGVFDLDIYVLTLSSITEDKLRSLVDELPSRCVVLLEDVDAVSSNRSNADFRQIVTGSPSQESKSASGRVSLSALLNVIDGVGSQEGRILIMTTNHPTRLDEALVRPGRVDKKVELGLADNQMTADLFCLVFKPVEGDVALPEDAQSGEDRRFREAAVSQRGEAERVERLAKGFAARVPELKLSPAEIFSFLLKYRQSPEEAIGNVEQLISKPIEAKSKPPKIFEETKPEDPQPEMNRATEWNEESSATEVPIETVQTPLASGQPITPPSSPNLSPSKCLVTLSDAQQLAKAVLDLQMVPAYAPMCICSHTPPEEPSEAGSTDLCSPCPGHTFPTNQPPAHNVTTKHVQQFFDILSSFHTKQEPSSKSPDSVRASEDAKPDAVPPEDVGSEGSRPEFKTVDELWDGKAHTYAIVESSKPVAQATRLDQYVFVVRRRVDKKTKVITCYVDINSEPLRVTLRDVLRDVGGISLNERKLSVEQNLLYNTLPELERRQSWNEIAFAPLDQQTEHLGLLVEYIKMAYSDTAQSLVSLLSTGHITYDLLWALFKPNDLVYTTCPGTHKPRCVRYNFGEEKKTIVGTTYWSLDCCYLDFNGEVISLFPIELKIAKFRGAMHINALDAFPLQYHAEATTVRADLLGCGRKFMSLTGPRHRHCNGKAFYVRDGEPVQVRIDSRIMVDAACFRKMNPNYFRPRVVVDLDDGFDISAYLKPFHETSSVVPSDDASSATSFELASRTLLDQPEGSVGEQAEMSDEYLLMCCPTVPGFSLKDKLWVEFAVADIKEIQWSSAPFDCLTLPDEQRETIMAVTESGSGSNSGAEFDDFIDGKGRGIILLLHGKPGVGKTMTVEAIAELRRKPVYSISAGDLPTDAGRLEGQLFKVFQVARQWDAILLLDEADVFLEERAPKDIHRNGVVSVFLRTMEYCQGIMVLTTNRVTEFDPAALSRIHLKVKYDDLTSNAKSAVWRGFLDRAHTSYGPPSVSADELNRLSNTHLNGREIRNTVAIARKLAIRQGSKVLFAHLNEAVAASKEFLSEFNGLDHVSSVFL